MKIAGDGSIRFYDGMTYKSKSIGKGYKADRGQMNRDQVFIGADTLQSDKKIAGEAAHKVIQEVRSATPHEKIERLKQQVADGTYQPETDKIAARMLLGKELV